MAIRFSAARLRRSSSFLRLTGVSVAVFDAMLAQLRDPWDAQQARKARSGRPLDVGGLEDRLLVIAVYL